MPMITFLVRDQNKNKGCHLLVSTVKCVCVDEDGVNQGTTKEYKKNVEKDQFGNNNNNIVFFSRTSIDFRTRCRGQRWSSARQRTWRTGPTLIFSAAGTYSNLIDSGAATYKLQWPPEQLGPLFSGLRLLFSADPKPALNGETVATFAISLIKCMDI